jgi:hypothetical protein
VPTEEISNPALQSLESILRQDEIQFLPIPDDETEKAEELKRKKLPRCAA